MNMNSHKIIISAAVTTFLVLCAMPTRPAAAADAVDMYVRQAREPIDALRAIIERDSTGSPLVVVFDDALAVEESSGVPEYDIKDLDDRVTPWLDAIAAVALDGIGGRRMLVASASRPFATDATRDGWRAAFEARLRHRSATADRLEAIPAAEWMLALGLESPGSHLVFVYFDARRLAARTRTSGGAKGDAGLTEGASRYWDLGEIQQVLADTQCRLSAIGPEAPLGDETAFMELPMMPWCSRPCRATDRFGQIGIPGIDACLSAGDDFEVERMDVPTLLQLANSAFTLQGLRASYGEGAKLAQRFFAVDPSPRFRSMLPAFTSDGPGSAPRVTDVPSGYGVWGVAAAVANRSGSYVLIARERTEWLDHCRFDPVFRSDVAPAYDTYVPPAGVVRDDPCVCELAVILDRLASRTPGVTAAGAAEPQPSWWCWSPDESGEIALDAGVHAGSPIGVIPRRREDVLAFVRAVRTVALPEYDRASRAMERLVTRRESERWSGSRPRSRAVFLATWFWIEQSAWNLEALAIHLEGAVRHAPRSKRAFHTLVAEYVRVSDLCTEPDGVEAGTESADRIRPTAAHAGARVHPLAAGERSDAFRRQRDFDDVAAEVQPELRKRLQRVRHVASSVVSALPSGPWRWSVYYSSLHGYIDAREEETQNPYLGGFSRRAVPGPSSE